MHYVQAIDFTILHQQVASLPDDMSILAINWRAEQGH